MARNGFITRLRSMLQGRHARSLVNSRFGAGGRSDKSTGFDYVPTRFVGRRDLEVMYVESWAARKVIDIPVDDAVIRWREWSKSGRIINVLRESEAEYQVRDKIALAMKNARLYGSSALMIVTTEEDMTRPFTPERIRRGDLVALIPIDRYSMHAYSRETDIRSPFYGMPVIYEIGKRYGERLAVHTSRLLRFDGIPPLSPAGFDQYDSYWGISELVPVINAVKNEDSTAKAAAHLVQENSIPIMGIDNYASMVAGERPDEPTLEKRLSEMSRTKSIYGIVARDSTETIERLSVNMSGIPQLLDREQQRVAAAADIPMTRFMSQSPAGLNSTGDSDLRNYAIKVASIQTRLLTDPLRTLDEVLLRNAGLSGRNVPEYEWVPLIEMGEKEQADTLHKRVLAMDIAIKMQALSPDEARSSLSNTLGLPTLSGTVVTQDEPEEEPEGAIPFPQADEE